MATFLVTGGAGFIGSHIVGALVGSGESVRVLDNFSSGTRANLPADSDRFSIHEEDICNLGRIRPHFEGAQYVIHLAALPSVGRSVADPLASNAVNLDGTLNVLVAARDAGVKRLVFAASAAAYGDNPALPRTESLPPDPLSPYALQKIAGEYYCRVFTRLFCLETVALRYFNIFGPRQNPESPYTGVLSKFINAYLREEAPTIFGDGGQSRDFTHVDNVVNATLRACAAAGAAGKVINIGTGERHTLNQTVELLNRIFGRQITPRHGPPRPGDSRHSQADISLARQFLGYEPTVRFEDGLRRTVEWFLSGAAREGGQ